ncbi:MAG: hypothetical protein Q4C37_02330 [Bacteroidales bacterium]|nr:hypothetical protein [Bacteroidales bacterium]
MKSNKVRIGIAIALVLVAFVMLGMASSIHHDTIIQWWLPLSVSIAPALLAGWLCRKLTRAITGISKTWALFLIGVVYFIPVFTCGFYAVNYFGSDPSTKTTFRSEVVGKHSEKHYRTRRLSRNRAVRGEPYYLYYLTLRTPQGGLKKVEVSTDRYVKTRRGQKATLDMEMGKLGYPVIKHYDIPAYAPAPRRRPHPVPRRSPSGAPV